MKIIYTFNFFINLYYLFKQIINKLHKSIYIDIVCFYFISQLTILENIY